MLEEFWANEAAANAAPTADLESLSYITLPLSRFPLGCCSDDEIREIEDQLLAFANARCLNLAGKTNTELKATYGPANFETVTSYGDTCDALLLLLRDYAAALIAREKFAEAVPVLEFCVGIKSDLSAHYTMLGQCYKTLGKKNALENLISRVQDSDLVLRRAILDALE